LRSGRASPFSRWGSPEIEKQAQDNGQTALVGYLYAEAVVEEIDRAAAAFTVTAPKKAESVIIHYTDGSWEQL
jgi:hypothetical protein